MIEINKIYLGDCLEIMKNIDDKSIDLVVIDPPYDIAVSQGAGAFGLAKKLHYKQFESISNGFDEKILNELCRIMKKINIYIFCSSKQISMLLDFFVKNMKCNFTLISWHKTNPVPSCGNSYMPDTEFCLFFREKGVKVYGTAETKKTYYVTPINIKDKKLWKHPTIKPLEIIRNLIINSSNKGETVLDCFSGSGTTALAACQLERKFISIEINKEFYDLSNQRLDEYRKQGKLF